MNIALIGYGNMGQEIERVVKEEKHHEVVSISYRDRNEGLDLQGIQRADVAIDFTSPEVVMENIRQVVTLGIPLVIGTTGWYDKVDQVEQLVKQTDGAVIYGQNFSIGANIFFKVVAYASSLLGRYEGYDVFGIETHHRGKKDSPSGTARKLADTVLEHFPRKQRLQTETLNRQLESEELHFVAVRGGRNFGRHEVVFDSNADEIRLIHQAWGRRGFAEGTLVAAEFIKDKKGFYDFTLLFEEKEGSR